VTGTVDATNIKQNGFSILPVGLGPIPWSGLTAPSGWVLCNGQLLSRTTYADLWAFAQTEIAAGNTLYGVGDSSTTFSVPDMRGRVPAGKDADIGGFALRLTTTYFGAAGTTLGAVGQSSERTTLVTGNLPPYTPSGTLSGTGTSAETNVQRDTSSITVATGGPNTIPLTNTGTVTINGNQYTFTGVAQGGTSTPIRTVQPTIITNYIIFAGV
jgi:microcystin-dependent protein